MLKRFLAVAAALSVGICFAVAAEPTANKADATAASRLVAQLGSDSFEDREKAEVALDGMGPAALDSLRSAVASKDRETRRRALELIQRIEKRQETEQLVQPKKVHLVFSDTPVTQAVQDIARKTGFTIQIEGDQSKLTGRKITLDTGEVPFWQAIDQFCAKAGLVERGSNAIAENAALSEDMQMQRAMRMRMWMVEQGGYGGPKPEMPLVFLDGKARELPTFYGGALRVRALPRNAPAGNNSQAVTPVNRPEGETLLTIEVSPEPKLGMQSVLSVRIDKVLDQQGSEIAPPMPFIKDAYDSDDPEMEIRAWRGGMYPNGMGNGQQNLSKQLPIHLPKTRDVKKLKELRGSVALEVLTPVQPLLTLEDVLHAAGKSERGADGGSLKIEEIKRDDKGVVTMKVIVEKFVPGGTDAMVARMRMWGRVYNPQPQTDLNAVSRILQLADDKGTAIPLVSVSSKQIDDFGLTTEYDLTFKPTNDKTMPAKLTYLGQRETTIDVPFVLKDVPLNQ